MAETFKNQVDALTGFASTEDNALTDWLTAGAKEVINILPLKLKQKCATATGVGTDFKVDLDGLGQVLYVARENADDGYMVPCREIPSMYGGQATDSGSLLYYGTVSDPVYWIDGDNSGAATLYVKPTPTANQPAVVHHVAYPTVAHGDTAIANFPDEAEYLVPLYASIKALQRLMNNMKGSLVHSDQDGSYTAPTALNISGGAGSQGWEQVRNFLEREEDVELASATIQGLSQEMQQFIQEYQWYAAQQQKLQADYDKGVQIIIGPQAS